MRTHTNDFKNQIKTFGRETDCKITYGTTELGKEDLNSVDIHYEGAFLKSVMKQLDIDSNVDIPTGTIISCQFGLNVNNSYEYINLGNFVVYSSEKQEDTNSWKITCYDKMLYSMQSYYKLESKNQFDKDNANILSAYISGSKVITSSDPDITIYIPCEPNTTYTVQKMYDPGGTTNKFRVGTTSSVPQYGDTVSDYYGETSGTTRTTYTFTTSSSANYLLFFCYTNNQTTSLEEMLSSIQIEKGSQASRYVPYFQYPITIKDYISQLCYNIGITFANENDSFVNYDKNIQGELYLDADGNDLGYTFRDVLDEIAGVTASTICINDDDELEIRYINDTQGNNTFNTSYIVTNNKWSVIDDYTNDFIFEDAWGDTFIDNSNVAKVFKPNKQYTISFKFKIISRPSSFSRYNHNNFFALHGGGTGFVISNALKNTGNIGTWYEQTSTITTPSDLSNFRLLIYNYKNANNENDGEIEIKELMIKEGNNAEWEPYGDTIDEEYLKDVNVTFGEKFGPVNSVVLSRSAESDNIYEKDDDSVQANGLCEIKIKDNQILNGNNRDEFLPGIFNQLNGLEYYVNDYVSTGVCYLDLCDKYNVKIDDKFYSCIMLNDDIEITQGLKETMYAEKMEEGQTDYTKADKTDRKINQAYIIVDKQNQQIDSVVQTIHTLSDMVDSQGNDIDALGTRLTQTVNSITANVTSLQDTLDNGVTLVKTTTVTIDDSGLSVATDTSRTSTLMTADKFSINSGGKELAFFGYDEEINSTKAQMDNLTVTNYFIAGYHRVEKFERNGEQRTGYFYIGG